MFRLLVYNMDIFTRSPFAQFQRVPFTSWSMWLVELCIMQPAQLKVEALFSQVVLWQNLIIINMTYLERYLKRRINIPKWLPCLESYFGSLSKSKIIPLIVSKNRQFRPLSSQWCQLYIILCSEHLLLNQKQNKKNTFSSLFQNPHRLWVLMTLYFKNVSFWRGKIMRYKYEFYFL